jgi:hypothetical protein
MSCRAAFFAANARRRGKNAAAMKTLRFLPLAFIAGAHGFPMFVSYLAVLAAVVGVVKLFR